MAFTIAPDLKTMRCAGGEPIFFSYQPASSTGVPEDLSGREFVFIIYDSRSNDEVRYEDGFVIATGDDPAVYWTLPGLVSAELAEAKRGNLAWELAERLDDGRDVIKSGEFKIDASAPRVADNPTATFSRYITRITRLNDPDNLLAAKFDRKVHLYVPDASIPSPAVTLNPLRMTGTMTQGSPAIGVWLTGRTAGSTIVFNIAGLSVDADGHVSGTPASGGSLNATEILARATNSPRTSAGLMIVAAAPVEPPIEQPGDDIDLTPTGPDIFYAQPNEYTPLLLNVPADASGITLARAFTDSELKIRVREETVSFTPASGKWTTNATAGPFNVAGEGIISTATMQQNGTGASTLNNGRIVLAANQYLETGALGMQFVDTGNAENTLSPPSFTFRFKGVVPGNRTKPALLGCFSGPDGAVFNFLLDDWGRRMRVEYGGRGNWNNVPSDEYATDLNGADHVIEVTYTDDPSGAGGTLTFFADGQQLGSPRPAPQKLKLASGVSFQVNASEGNTSNSIGNMEVEYVEVSYGKPVITSNYVTVDDGPITAAKLNQLIVDATGVTATQPTRKLTYKVGSAPAVDVNIVVGEIAVPATGAAYRAVLEDWSSGEAVAHPNQLIMTRIAVQNASFEDPVLAAAQGKWTEVLPQGPVPVLDGIRYGCEAVRQGNYVVFQFNYSIDRATEPFGAVESLNTYMRPHKWAIYDKAGTLIKRIEQPDGKPLNPSDTTPVWEGPYDGRSVARVSETNRWYPHGTVRSTIRWENGRPPAYNQAFLNQNLPVFDIQVPYASHTNGSTNGFDLRIYCGGNGGQGQSNGFSNWKCIPFKWGVETYDSIKAWATTTKDPYKHLYNDFGLTPNAALHLEATPFNSAGRSPIVGPGGARDDRQIVAEPVAQYMSDVNGVRRHDDLALSTIAWNYMKSYAADAVHPVEGGKMKPLYKDVVRRAITLGNHYYGRGEHNIPDNSTLFVQSGRLDGTTASQNPTTVHVPYGGASAKKPYFGWFEIDQSHAHQFPHWGSMLWKDPTFAMMGVSFSDHCRLYSPSIIDSPWNPFEFVSRDKAWLFTHATLLWKTASKTSTRLYRRDEIMEWIVADFEAYYDRYYVSTPGFANPPTTISGSGVARQNDAVFAAARLFGPVRYDDSGLGFSEFQAGYWLSALHAAHKLGFLDALRAASAKCATIVDFLIGLHRTHIVGKLNGGMLLNPVDSDYEIRFWKPETITAAGGVVANLPQTYAACQSVWGSATSWDTRLAPNGQSFTRDGQALDQVLAGPSLLKDMGLTGADLDAAEAEANRLRNSKIAEEDARGPALAGSGHFRWLQTTNNPPRRAG